MIKVGDKFIIKISEVFRDLPFSEEKLYKIEGLEWIAFDEKVIEKLEKYDKKPSVPSEIAKEMGYEQGINDYSDAIRKICLNQDDGGLSSRELVDIFDKSCVTDILVEISPQEIIKRINNYENELEKEIRAGDVVVVLHNNYSFIVVKISDDGHVFGFDKNGFWNFEKIQDVRKTGQHYDIDKILESMKQNTKG